MSLKGYGKQLRIDLGEKQSKEEQLDEGLMRNYLGGVGYGSRVLFSELDEKTDPLGPENKLLFATGLLTGNNMPGGGSVEICFKSPLTGGWGESRSGGNFGPDLRKTGYDYVIFEGKSPEPVYIVLTDEGLEFKPAKNLLGKTIEEKTDAIREEMKDGKISIMCIGPGGENLVPYSTIMCDGRAAGRCGAGAVMGSKNLLAFVVKGNQELKVADKEKFRAAIRKAMKEVRKNPDSAEFKKHGTTGDIPGCDSMGDWPTKNWQSNSWGKGEILYGHFFENNLVRPNDCYTGCPVGCGRIIKVEDGKFKTPEHEGGEYESISAFTAFLLNEDMDCAVHCTYLCNQLGIDTISAGGTIAFAIECFENGLIDKNKTEGIELKWGDPDILPELVKKIANREGIGDLLAKGVRRAAEIIGGNAMDYAIHGKGLEAPGHDPRSGKALGVTYGTASRGMCHIHPLEGMLYDSGKVDFGLKPYGLQDPETIDRWDEKGKGKAVKILQDACILPDVLGNCKFMMYCGMTLDHFAEIISGATGWDMTVEELLKAGERIANLQKLFNLREGFGINEDQLPARMRQVPVFGTYSSEERCGINDYEMMLQEYYEARGWDEEGNIPKEKLKELGLE